MLVNSRLALILLINVAVAAARQTAQAQSVSNAPANAAPQIVLLTIEGTVEVAPAGTTRQRYARMLEQVQDSGSPMPGPAFR